MKEPATHCKRGHEYTPENTAPRSDGGRRCRACSAAWHRENWAKNDAYRERAIARMTARYHSTDPETHRKVSAEIVRIIARDRQRRVDQKLAQQPDTALGEAVRLAINEIGEQAWRATASRTRLTSAGTSSDEN